MICEQCHGTKVIHQFLSLMGGELWQDVPCPSCGGNGLQYCCDGLREQPCDDIAEEIGN